MAYQQQQDMRYSQQPQHMPNQPDMQQHQPFMFATQVPHHQPPPSGPPPQMQINGTTIYNSFTNQPLYTYTISKAPDSDLPNSLISLRHIPTGITIGTIRRGGSSTASTCWGICGCLSSTVEEDIATTDSDLPNSLISLRHIPTGITIGTIRRGGSSTASTCWGICGCLSSTVEEDIATIGVQGEKAVIKDMGTGRSCWAWKPTWVKQGVAGEWAFFGDTGFGEGVVLRDAVANGKDVLRVEGGGEVNFGAAAAVLTEEMIGEIMLILVGLRVNGEDEKEGWLEELLRW